MKTVQEIIQELVEFPPDAHVYAYEGEMVGLVIVDNGGNQIGTIDAYPEGC